MVKRLKIQHSQEKKNLKKEIKPAIAKIQQQESDDDDKTISDFSDNSIDESESED